VPPHLLLVAVEPLGEGAELFAWLGPALGKRLGVPILIGEPLPLRDEWLDAERGQYRSNQIVDALVARDAGEPPGHWVLAVTAADLFAEERRFVFGEATHGGAWALVSLARLRPEGPTARGARLVRRRALKEAVHELGHLAGLGHCDREECVMHPSGELEDTDRKSASYCPACRSRVRDPYGIDGGPQPG